MFCPNCGQKETQSIQFCRFCGTNLSSVRRLTGSPETPAIPTREEIGKFISNKIRQTGSPRDLARLLPEIEKFLESPEEKKMRRMRSGSLVALIGFGVAVGFLIASILGPDKDVIVLAAFGLVTFFIGLALMLNGFFFTVPKDTPTATSFAAGSDQGFLGTPTNELLMPPDARTEFSSVTENTTRHLKEELLNRKE